MNRGGINPQPELAASSAYGAIVVPGLILVAMTSPLLLIADGVAATQAYAPLYPPIPSLLLLTAAGA